MQRNPFDLGLKLQLDGFRLPSKAISRKRRKIELRSQLITNMKSMWAFSLCKSRWPWMTLYGQDACAITRNQEIINYGRNVRLMLVLLPTFYFCEGISLLAITTLRSTYIWSRKSDRKIVILKLLCKCNHITCLYALDYSNCIGFRRSWFLISTSCLINSSNINCKSTYFVKLSVVGLKFQLYCAFNHAYCWHTLINNSRVYK